MKRKIVSILAIIILIYISILSRIVLKLEKDISPYGYIRLTDRNGELLAIKSFKNGYSLPYTGNLNIQLIENIVTIEDKRFYRHHGIDLISKFGVIIESLGAGGFTRGGSTITEQYIKNRYFPLTKRTILQKIKEGFYAQALEITASKEEILRKYLETVYMGNGLYGIGAAIENYFPEEKIEILSDDALAEIIVRLRFPNLSGNSESYYGTIVNKLGLQRNHNPLPKREKKSFVNLFPFVTERIEKEIIIFCNGEEGKLHEFLKEIPPDLCSSPFRDIHTTLDKNATHEALDSLEGVLFSLTEKNVKNGAILVKNMREDSILIYIGNRIETTDNRIDMIEKRRSVGSVMKPFLYLIAYHSHDPNSFILDEKKIYATEEDGVSYISENYIPKAYGPTTLKEALGNSLNSSAVRLTEYIGVGRIYSSLKSIGIPLDRDVGYYGYGIFLGAMELTLESVVNAYEKLTDLKDKHNFLLYENLKNPKNRGMTFGESSILNSSIPLAVKTGTSTDFYDNWTVGYNDEFVIGVWVGNADRTSMRDVSGITGAGPIYHKVAEDLMERGYIKNRVIPLPEGVEEKTLCNDESCLQKEMTYTLSGYTRKSRPASRIYYEEDFVTPLSREEKENWKIR